MAREDPQLKIRLPEALKDRVENVARQNGRSMNAEITARLEESFSMPRQLFLQETQTQILSTKAELSTIALRFELARARSDNLDIRIRLIRAEAERLTKEARTDADFERARENLEQLTAVQAENEALKLEVRSILREREIAISNLDRLQEIFHRSAEEIESRVREGLAARTAAESAAKSS